MKLNALVTSGALAVSVSLLSTAPAWAWSPLVETSCAAGIVANWATGCNSTDVYIWDPNLDPPNWQMDSGRAIAIAQDTGYYLWAVGNPSRGIFFGFTQGGSNPEWTEVSTTAFNGDTIQFATVAAGSPEIGSGYSGTSNQVWATDTSGNVWLWDGYVGISGGGLPRRECRWLLVRDAASPQRRREGRYADREV